MAHSHWPHIKRKSHKKILKKLQKLRVLNEYNAFQIGWRHLELILICLEDQNRSQRLNSKIGRVPNQFQTHNWEKIGPIQNQQGEFEIHCEFQTHPLPMQKNHIFEFKCMPLA